MLELSKDKLDMIMIRPHRCSVWVENSEDEVAGLVYVKDRKIIFRPACEEEEIILELRDKQWNQRDNEEYQEFYMVSKPYKIPFTNLTYNFSLWLIFEMDVDYNPVDLEIL